MNSSKDKYNHLIKNLEISSSKNSIFSKKLGQKAFLSLGQGNLCEWLEELLPNTRLIIEPKIIGSIIGIQYLNGELSKAINQNCGNITKQVKSLKSVPNKLPIKKRIEIRGVLYGEEKTSIKNNDKKCIGPQQTHIEPKGYNFCAYQIYHCKINHFQALQELKNLAFEIPETQFTNFTSDIDLYYQCWKEGKLFTSYPTSGIVVKINSRKLQKDLGENNLSIHWAYAIT